MVREKSIRVLFGVLSLALLSCCASQAGASSSDVSIAFYTPATTSQTPTPAVTRAPIYSPTPTHGAHHTATPVQTAVVPRANIVVLDGVYDDGRENGGTGVYVAKTINEEVGSIQVGEGSSEELLGEYENLDGENAADAMGAETVQNERLNADGRGEETNRITNVNMSEKRSAAPSIRALPGREEAGLSVGTIGFVAGVGLLLFVIIAFLLYKRRWRNWEG